MIDNFGVTHAFEHGLHAEIIEGYPKTTIVESAKELPDCDLVVLAPPDGRHLQGATALPEFVHPEGNAVYIVGENNVQFDPDFLADREYQSVFVPSAKLEFHALVAASCALYDRRAKQWVK